MMFALVLGKSSIAWLLNAISSDSKNRTISEYDDSIPGLDACGLYFDAIIHIPM